LGFIPEDLKFDVLEFSSKIERKTAKSLFKEYGSFGWISSSDAHHLEDSRKKGFNLFIKEPAIGEIAFSLEGYPGQMGRMVTGEKGINYGRFILTYT